MLLVKNLKQTQTLQNFVSFKTQRANHHALGMEVMMVELITFDGVPVIRWGKNPVVPSRKGQKKETGAKCCKPKCEGLFLLLPIKDVYSLLTSSHSFPSIYTYHSSAITVTSVDGHMHQCQKRKTVLQQSIFSKLPSFLVLRY